MKKILTVLFLLISVNLSALQHIPESVSGYLDTNGDQLEDGFIAFYSTSGLSTFKNVYSDYNGNTTVSQTGTSYGIQLNSSGQPTSGGNAIALFGDGIYWVVIRDEDGVIVNTYESIVYKEPVSSSGATLYIDVSANYGTEDSDIQSLLSDYTGTDRVTFLFDGDFTISSSQAFTQYHRLRFVKGATFTVESGNTLTINSDDVIFGHNIK